MNPYNAYKYLYYRIYSWQLLAWGEANQPHFNALLGVTVLVYFNILSLLNGFEALTELGILNQIGKIHALTSGAVIGVINYFIFLRNGKYKLIAKHFKKETEIEKKRRLIWCWASVIFTFACFFASLLMLPVNLNK